MEYLIRRVAAKPPLAGDLGAPQWRHADVAEIASFHPRSSDHRPQTAVWMLHDDDGLYVRFHVRDRYVVCTRTENQSLTCKDSCVEVYLEPFPGQKGYFNFEMNCGGTLLLFYVIDATRSPAGIFRHKHIVPQSLIDTMRIHHSLPRTLEKEIAEPVEWTLECFIPYSLMETYVGKLPPAGERGAWRGNFHKCADDSSHPHWASWSPIGEALNFHVPSTFGTFRFEG